MNEATWPMEDLEAVPNCPVCGNAQRSLLYTELTDRVFCVAPGKWTLYRCDQCTSAWLDPRPTAASIGRAYEEYYTHTAEDAPESLPKNPLVRQLHAWVNDYINTRYGLKRRPASFGGRWLVPLVPSFSAKANAKMRHLPRPPSDGGRLLDVGFGSGGFLKLAGEMGWQAEGIDFDQKAVEVARARGLNVRCASAADLSEQDEQYDVITLSHVIEHVHDPISLLKDLYRLLKPNGLLWLETPNLDSLGATSFGAAWMALDPPRHLALFNQISLKESLFQAGFDHISQHWNGMVLFSIYAQSQAISRGKCGQEAIHQVLPSFSAVLAELREMVLPSRREYITFIAKK